MPLLLEAKMRGPLYRKTTDNAAPAIFRAECLDEFKADEALPICQGRSRIVLRL